MLVKSSSADYDTAWQSAADATAAPYYRSGAYYGAAVPLITSAISQERVYGTILRIERTVTIDRIRAQITTIGSSGAVMRLGVYRQTSGSVTALVVDAGTIDATVLGVASIALSPAVTLVPGLYVIVGCMQGNPVTPPQCYAVDYRGRSPHTPGADGSDIRAGSGIWIAQPVSGALPSSGSYLPQNIAYVPYVDVRIA